MSEGVTNNSARLRLGFSGSKWEEVINDCSQLEDKPTPFSRRVLVDERVVTASKASKYLKCGCGSVRQAAITLVTLEECG